MLQWETDVRAAAWLSDRIHGFLDDVGSVVPHGFEAYARIFHPLRDLQDTSWADLALRHGRIVHPEMQYHWIAHPVGERAHPHEHFRHVAVGTVPEPELRSLVAVLRRHTAPEERCYFSVWEGYGQLHGGLAVTVVTSSGVSHPPGIVPPEVLDGPRVELPYRSYLLASGTLPEALDLRAQLQQQSPNLWWPADRSWCVATEIDLGCTYVGGPEALIADVLAAGDLEALRCRVTDLVIGDPPNAALDGEAW